MAAAYDARDRMIAWGRMRAGYRSDGQRAWKIMLDENGAEVSRQYFLYDGDHLLCELDGQLRVTSTSTWGANGLVSRATNSYDGSGNPTDGKTTFYAYDERGSVAERVTDSGSGTPVVNHVAFDAWGYGTAGDSVGFGGKWGYYTDTETGLILCTHRYYDPSKQRWVTRDPIEYDGGLNLYSYVSNSPLKYTDPNGLYIETVWDAVNVAAGFGAFTYDLNEGNYGWAAVDAAGIIYDSIATGVPILPGGVGVARSSAIATARTTVRVGAGPLNVARIIVAKNIANNIRGL